MSGSTSGEDPSHYGHTGTSDAALMAAANGEPNIKHVQAHEGSTITKLSEALESNWIAWRERIKRVLRLCGVETYAKGKIQCPADAAEAENWKYNDNYAQVMIINNITSTEMVHVGQCDTAKAMWDNLEVVHESKGHQTIVSIIRNLFHTKADEDSDINEHLNQLKQYRERIMKTTSRFPMSCSRS